jgi:hypothetical protein
MFFGDKNSYYLYHFADWVALSSLKLAPFSAVER